MAIEIRRHLACISRGTVRKTMVSLFKDRHLNTASPVGFVCSNVAADSMDVSPSFKSKYSHNTACGLKTKLIVLVIVSFCIGRSQGLDCDINFHNSASLNNKMISSLHLWSKTGLGSAADCVNACSRHWRCVSVFYNTLTDTCTAHGVQFYSAEFSLDEEGSLYFTTDVDKRDCADILSIHPDSSDGVYVINPDDGKGHAGVYCDMPIVEGEWSVTEDCADILLKDPEAQNGVYFVKPGSDVEHFRVYCDMTQHGGGWTVFQRREDNTVNFNQNWNTYKNGFGIPNGEFWLGNDRISGLSSRKPSQLRIDMRDKTGESGYATYSTFRVENEAAKYRLTATGFAGNRGDSLENVHSGRYFSTNDRDNDQNGWFHCANHWGGGWWMNSCFWSNLNGNYGNDAGSKGINWKTWHGFEYSMPWTEMKMKPA